MLNDLYMAGNKKFAADTKTAMRGASPNAGSDDQEKDMGATP